MSSTPSRDSTASIVGRRKETFFALVDGNNFYVSCERLFNPALRGRPVVVLSSNDGCVISRSAEAKELGIAMGAPFFRVRERLANHQAVVLSSNYALYGDLSRRVMNILGRFSPAVEVYSIDEAFLDWGGLDPERRRRLARELRDTVHRWTGIPVAVGLGTTKTLAKVAARLAKRVPRSAGVVDLGPAAGRERALALTPVEEVWGVGRRLAPRLQKRGLRTALDLGRTDDGSLRREGGVNLQRVGLELRGLSCYGLDQGPATPRSVRCSRSFAAPVRDRETLREAVAVFMSRAAEKIRRQGLAAGALTVYLRTGRYAAGKFHYHSWTGGLPVASNSTRELLVRAVAAVEQLFAAGCPYRKAGVVLHDLRPAALVTPSLLDSVDREREARLLAAVDDINDRFGAGKVRFAVASEQRCWRSRAANLTPAYTTRWDELPVVR